jgi:hypothetical protein
MRRMLHILALLGAALLLAAPAGAAEGFTLLWSGDLLGNVRPCGS